MNLRKNMNTKTKKETNINKGIKNSKMDINTRNRYTGKILL